MIYIKFNDISAKIPVTEVRRLSNNIIRLTGAVANISGFKAYIDEEEVGDFSDYTTIYRVVENNIYFSNDGSVYQNPTATVKINFTGDTEADRPKEVKVILSNDNLLVVSSPWVKEIEYSENEYPSILFADNITNYEKYINDLEVMYVFVSEAERIKREVEKLKAELSQTDYKIIKCSEFQLAGLEAPYDITELHAARQAIRDKINELENQL